MSFREFTLPKAKHDFGLTTDMTQASFTSVPAVRLSDPMRQYLAVVEAKKDSIPDGLG